MSDPEVLIEQLRRSNRRWKALALAACFTLLLAAVGTMVAAYRARVQVEAQIQAAEALARASLEAANRAHPR